jgi:hypothetical protein
MSSQLTFRLQMSAVVCTVVAKKTFKDCVRKPFSTFLAIIQELVGRSENLEGQKYKNKVKNNNSLVQESGCLEIGKNNQNLIEMTLNLNFC